MKSQVKEALDAELAKYTAPDNDHLRLYRGILSTPTGGIPVKKIGKGAFAEVYREQVPPGRVFALTDDDVYDKEIAAMVHNDLPDNPHVPAVERFGHTHDKTVYEMPFYKTPLRSKASSQAWKDYRTVEDCWRKAGGGKNVPGRSGYDVTSETAECARASGVTQGVGDALEGFKDWAANYSDQYTFEFSPRNLATNEVGDLVLLDVLFDREQLAKQLEVQRRAREAKERAARWR